MTYMKKFLIAASVAALCACGGGSSSDTSNVSGVSTASQVSVVTAQQ